MRVKAIIRYSGKITEWNGDINGVFDVRASKRFQFYKTHDLDLSIDAFNVINLLNKFKGVNQSLGTPASGSTTAVSGFDRMNQRFVYGVSTELLLLHQVHLFNFRSEPAIAFNKL